MTSEAFCAAVDWGTSAFRLWLLDRQGNVLAESAGPDGILNVEAGAYPAVLERHLNIVGVAADLPVMICGMAGARQGWVEAPYLDVPTALHAIPDHAIRINDPAREIRILPGLAQRAIDRPDVMRGEETLLLGLDLKDATVCMPGTHSKWVRIEGQQVSGFQTFMTGELYAVLSQHSILRHSAEGEGSEDASPGFMRGLDVALSQGESGLSSLFGVRARELLGQGHGDGAAYLSGLLVGLEVSELEAREAILLTSGRLGKLYGAALDRAGIGFRFKDASVAAQKGLFIAARQVWG